MRCLSLRRVFTTWKTSTVFSFLALSKRFHRPQRTPDREEPSLREINASLAEQFFQLKCFRHWKAASEHIL